MWCVGCAADSVSSGYERAEPAGIRRVTTRSACAGNPGAARAGAPGARGVTATSLFDGHDAAINIMRRILQSQGAEVIHLGHNRSVDEVVKAVIEEDAVAVAIPSDQGRRHRRTSPTWWTPWWRSATREGQRRRCGVISPRRSAIAERRIRTYVGMASGWA